MWHSHPICCLRPAAAAVAAALALLSPLASPAASPGAEPVRLRRVPDGGLQPQVAVDERGAWHLVYFRGKPEGGDAWWSMSTDDGARFSPPRRVNHAAGDVVAMGNIRGAQLALGRGGRVHVAWNGARSIEVGQRRVQPLRYARLDDPQRGFAPERNVIQSAFGLDGGSSIAADRQGHVYITWHAPPPGKNGESDRAIWLARSDDDGRTFAAERNLLADESGVCACCGMRTHVDAGGDLHVLYRAAARQVERPMRLLDVRGATGAVQEQTLHRWLHNGCPMSSCQFAERDGAVWAAWETGDNVYFARLGEGDQPRCPSGSPRARKHPALAINSRGELLLAWTEGMSWGRPGTVAWQVYDRSGEPTGQRGQTEGVPAWSLVAAVAGADNRFTILY